MARTAWKAVALGGVLLVGGLVSGLWPLTAAGAFIAITGAVVVILAELGARRAGGPRGDGR